MWVLCTCAPAELGVIRTYFDGAGIQYTESTNLEYDL
jgi:hypothetical protein